jgi:hypothetical protein
MKEWKDYHTPLGIVRAFLEPDEDVTALFPQAVPGTLFVVNPMDTDGGLATAKALADSATGDVVTLCMRDDTVETGEAVAKVLREMARCQGRDVEVRVFAPYQLDPEYRDAVHDLFYWQHQDGTSFNCRLFELMQKADWDNLQRLHRGWPWLFHAWQDWNNAPGQGRQWFTRFGCKLPEDAPAPLQTTGGTDPAPIPPDAPTAHSQA